MNMRRDDLCAKSRTLSCQWGSRGKCGWSRDAGPGTRKSIAAMSRSHKNCKTFQASLEKNRLLVGAAHGRDGSCGKPLLSREPEIDTWDQRPSAVTLPPTSATNCDECQYVAAPRDDWRPRRPGCGWKHPDRTACVGGSRRSAGLVPRRTPPGARRG